MTDAQEPRRTAVRLLVTDEDGALLLFLNAGARGAGSEWWITPGGGVEAGESLHAAALRELREELGSVFADTAVVGPLLATRKGAHRYGTVERLFGEFYFPVTGGDPRTVSFEGFTAEERSVTRAFTWCTRDELEATHDTVWPSDLGAIWDHSLVTDRRGTDRRITESGLAREPLVLADRVDSIVPGVTRLDDAASHASLQRRSID